MKSINLISIIGTLTCLFQSICLAYNDNGLDNVDYSWLNPIIKIQAINKRNIDEGGAAYQYELIYNHYKNMKYVLDASSCYAPPFFCKSENKYLVSTYRIGSYIEIPCIRHLKGKTYIDFAEENEIDDIRGVEENFAKLAIKESFGGSKVPNLYRDIKYVEDYLAIKKISENVDHVYIGISYDVDEEDSKAQSYYVIFEWEYTFDPIGETLNRVLKSAVVAYTIVESVEYDFSNENLLNILKIIDNNRVTPLLKNINYSNMDPVFFVDEIKENNYRIGIVNSDNSKIAVKDVCSDAAPKLLSSYIGTGIYYVTTATGEIEQLNIIDAYGAKLDKNEKIAFYSEDSFGYDFNNFDLKATSLIKNSSKCLGEMGITRRKVRIFTDHFSEIKDNRLIRKSYDYTKNKTCFVYRCYYEVSQGGSSREIIIDFYTDIKFSNEEDKPQMILLGSNMIIAPELY